MLSATLSSSSFNAIWIVNPLSKALFRVLQCYHLFSKRRKSKKKNHKRLLMFLNCSRWGLVCSEIMFWDVSVMSPDSWCFRTFFQMKKKKLRWFNKSSVVRSVVTFYQRCAPQQDTHEDLSTVSAGTYFAVPVYLLVIGWSALLYHFQGEPAHLGCHYFILSIGCGNTIICCLIHHFYC